MNYCLPTISRNDYVHETIGQTDGRGEQRGSDSQCWYENFSLLDNVSKSSNFYVKKLYFEFVPQMYSILIKSFLTVVLSKMKNEKTIFFYLPMWHWQYMFVSPLFWSGLMTTIPPDIHQTINIKPVMRFFIRLMPEVLDKTWLQHLDKICHTLTLDK